MNPKDLERLVTRQMPCGKYMGLGVVQHEAITDGYVELFSEEA